MPSTQYPFVPKSTAYLERGQFWALPLPNGTFGAACVVGRHTQDGMPSSRLFVAGVVDWNGSALPTANQLAGRPVAKYAFAHIRAITETGGKILGSAALDLSGVPRDLESLAVSTWGLNVPVRIAQDIAKGA